MPILYATERLGPHFSKTEVVNKNLTYIGDAQYFDALTSDNCWRIQRISTVNNVTTTFFAFSGKFLGNWDLRATYFAGVPL